MTIFETLADYGSQTNDHIVLAQIVHAALNHSISEALSYLANGQRVPEDLLFANADGLARHVMHVEPAI